MPLAATRSFRRDVLSIINDAIADRKAASRHFVTCEKQCSACRLYSHEAKEHWHQRQNGRQHAYASRVLHPIPLLAWTGCIYLTQSCVFCLCWLFVWNTDLFCYHSRQTSGTGLLWSWLAFFLHDRHWMKIRTCHVLAVSAQTHGNAGKHGISPTSSKRL